MDRERAKELLPIIQAFADGKEIEYSVRGSNAWANTSYPTWIDDRDYRIKSEPKYRPFKDADECWEEMKKHKPLNNWRNKRGTRLQTIRRDSSKQNTYKP